MKRRTGSVQQITVTTNEDSELVKEMICSKAEFPEA